MKIFGSQCPNLQYIIILLFWISAGIVLAAENVIIVCVRRRPRRAAADAAGSADAIRYAARSSRGRCRSARCAGWSPRTSRRHISPTRTPCLLPLTPIRQDFEDGICTLLCICNLIM